MVRGNKDHLNEAKIKHGLNKTVTEATIAFLLPGSDSCNINIQHKFTVKKITALLIKMNINSTDTPYK
jgi:hypothetical protein